MTQKWIKVEGIITQGYQVASGIGQNSPYPKGTIEMQIPFFQALGLDLTAFFPGTLNVSISPYSFIVRKPEYTFRNIQWIAGYPAEDFSFSRCRIYFQDNCYDGLIYYPHPATKINHFQNASIIEILAPLIVGIQYGDSVKLEINSIEILLTE